MKTSFTATSLSPGVASQLSLGANGAHSTAGQRPFGFMKSLANEHVNPHSFSTAYLARRQNFDRWAKFPQLFKPGWTA